MPLQSWIYHWEEGEGSKWLRAAAAILAFLAVAGLFDALCFDGFQTEEAMEGAQLARNIAQGNGYTTDSIRPLTLYLLQAGAEAGQSSKVLAGPVPDLTNPPAYPALLAGLMKILPFNFTAKHWWSYQPDLWIAIFNQFIFFAVVAMVFLLARKLFEPRVAWLSAFLFAGTRLFWRFTASGLSIVFLLLVFAAVAWFLASLERRERAAASGDAESPGSLVPAIAVGALIGLGGLTRYAFAWLIVPALLFALTSVTRQKAKICLVMAVSFLIVMMPWLGRNFVISHHAFGTATYSIAAGTEAFPGDKIDRTTDPTAGLRRVGPSEIVNKFTENARDICGGELPLFGGNWIAAFFLAGTLFPFRNPGLSRLRLFLAGSLLLLFVVEAVTRTHVTSDSPEVNSENLLVLTAPLVFIYGAAFFFVLLDQFNLMPNEARTASAVFATVLCAPLLLALLSARHENINSQYSPLHIQKVAQWLGQDDYMTSDIPGGVAWYGGRKCVWLPLDDDTEFYKVNGSKPIRGLFLTQATTDKKYYSEMQADEKSWGHFVLECDVKGEVPTGFPLRKAPEPRGFLPAQLFLTDKVRWQGLPSQR